MHSTLYSPPIQHQITSDQSGHKHKIQNPVNKYYRRSHSPGERSSARPERGVKGTCHFPYADLRFPAGCPVHGNTTVERFAAHPCSARPALVEASSIHERALNPAHPPLIDSFLPITVVVTILSISGGWALNKLESSLPRAAGLRSS